MGYVFGTNSVNVSTVPLGGFDLPGTTAATQYSVYGATFTNGSTITVPYVDPTVPASSPRASMVLQEIMG